MNEYELQLSRDEFEFLTAVREFASTVGIENVRVLAHDVPFGAFRHPNVGGEHILGTEDNGRTWLCAIMRIEAFRFDMHSRSLPTDEPEAEPKLEPIESVLT